MQTEKTRPLPLIAAEMRRLMLEAVYRAASGHIGGSLSIAELLAVLYWRELRIDPKNPGDPGRDRMVLSKGHCSPALYAALAMRGYFPVEDLNGFRRIDSYLSGHVEMRHVPGVDMSAGSLGQGFSAAIGMALASILDNKDLRVYVILGDGELQEGQIWEAAMSASHYKLDNLVVIVDNNDLQISGRLENVLSPYPIGKKFEAFGFHVVEIDGHDLNQIESAFTRARAVNCKPSCIVAKTIKGKGVSFMENNAGWHGSPPNVEQYEAARDELDAVIAVLEKEAKENA